MSKFIISKQWHQEQIIGKSESGLYEAADALINMLYAFCPSMPESFDFIDWFCNITDPEERI